jgi:hypothetical protein
MPLIIHVFYENFEFFREFEFFQFWTFLKIFQILWNKGNKKITELRTILQRES